MTDLLPLLISIPHGGNQIPPDVLDRVNLTKRDIFFDGDALTREIYDFGAGVQKIVDTAIARAIVDVNRAPDDRPPSNPDGVVKTVTAHGVQVYRESMYPDDRLIEELLEKYHRAFHKRIDEILSGCKIELALDCHSMLEFAPPIGPGKGAPRPLICLSNRGDARGEPTEARGPITCPPRWIRRLADEFEGEFEDELAEGREVAINNPFSGGYNSQLHSKASGVPWIQVELNRKLYLTSPFFNEDILAVKKERIEELRKRTWLVIKRFWQSISD
jgi:formiminoglutamase